MTTGFAIAGQADPALVRQARPQAPFGVERVAAWSVPAFALAGLVLTHLEPDPAFTGSDGDLDELVVALAALVEDGRRAAQTVPPTDGDGGGVSR
ncbi:hypothetical protein [Cellulomonas soli]